MSTHDRNRAPESHATSPTSERSLRAGGGATARDLPARPSHELPQEAPREVQEALAVQLKASAATKYGFERDPFGVEPVQCERAAAASPVPADTLSIAADGVTGSSSSLPHAEAIQRSFGHHDVSGVEAHVGGTAAKAADAIGASAYATGHHVAFKQAPDLHTAAHEAAHVVQQRGGVQLKGGVGESGDAYEQHADAVADKVVRGESAQALLDNAVTARGASAPSMQRQAVGGSSAAPAGIAAPGHTNIPMVDSGFTCERGEGSECFFTPAQRQALKDEFDSRLVRTHANFQTAASEVRLDLLLEKDAGWGFVAELLFNVVSFTAVGGLLKGLNVLRKAATEKDALQVLTRATFGSPASQEFKDSLASMNTDMVEGVLVHFSKAARAELKSSTSTMPADRAQRDIFLNRVRDAHEQYLDNLRQQAPASLDDAQMLALVFSFDREHHTVSTYRTQLSDLLARYKQHGIDDIGKNRFGKRQVVRFRAYGQDRLAIVQMNDNRELFKYRGEPYHNDGKQVFVRWIDSDLQEAAEEMNELRNGTPPVVEAGHRLSSFGLGNKYVHGFTDAQGGPPEELNAWIDAAGGIDA